MSIGCLDVGIPRDYDNVQSLDVGFFREFYSFLNWSSSYAIFPWVVNNFSGIMIHQNKSNSMGIHHAKGFHDPSTYTRYTGWSEIATNFWTPCSLVHVASGVNRPFIVSPSCNRIAWRLPLRVSCVLFSVVIGVNWERAPSSHHRSFYPKFYLFLTTSATLCSW